MIPRPDPSGTARHQTDRPLTIMVAAMAGGLVLLGVVLAVVGAELVTPPAWMLLVVAAATAGAWALAVLAPVPHAAATGAAPALQSLVVLRAAVIEVPAIVGLALAFVAQPPNLTVFVLPALFALAGMWLFARPGAVRARLARDHSATSAHGGR